MEKVWPHPPGLPSFQCCAFLCLTLNDWDGLGTRLGKVNVLLDGKVCLISMLTKCILLTKKAGYSRNFNGNCMYVR